MPNPISTAQLATYAALFDFRSQVNNAVRQILAAYGLSGAQAGEGVQKLGRTSTTWDFQVNGATGETGSLRQDFGAGAYRNPYYSTYEGILTFQVTAPYEQEQAEDGSTIYRVADAHAREMDQSVAQLYAVFMEGLFPFTATTAGDVLPNLDVRQILPIDPDERPEEMREVNIARVRFRLRLAIRASALPA